jgi:hypothetical protein
VSRDLRRGSGWRSAGGRGAAGCDDGSRLVRPQRRRVAWWLAMPRTVVTWLVTGFLDPSPGTERSALQAVSTMASCPWRPMAASRSRGSADTRRRRPWHMDRPMSACRLFIAVVRAEDAAGVLDEPSLLGDRCGEEQGVQRGQSNPSRRTGRSRRQAGAARQATAGARRVRRPALWRPCRRARRRDRGPSRASASSFRCAARLVGMRQFLP